MGPATIQKARPSALSLSPRHLVPLASCRSAAMPGSPASVARSWLSRYPVDLWKWRVPSLRARGARSDRRGDVDLCVSDFLFAAVNVPMRGPVPVVLFEHNVEYLIWQRLCAVESTPVAPGAD